MSLRREFANMFWKKVKLTRWSFVVRPQNCRPAGRLDKLTFHSRCQGTAFHMACNTARLDALTKARNEL